MDQINQYLHDFEKTYERTGDLFWKVDDVRLKDLQLPYVGRLFIGPKFDEHHMKYWVKHHQIKVVISMGFKESPWIALHNSSQVANEPYFDLRALYNYDVEDEEKPEHVARMSNILPQIARQIHHHLTRGENVMIHCHWGMSRSASGILWFLTHFHNIPLLEALQHVKKHRKVIMPKTAFLELCHRPNL